MFALHIFGRDVERALAQFVHLGDMLGGYLALRGWRRHDEEGTWRPQALRHDRR
jgi:hypothetical protein